MHEVRGSHREAHVSLPEGGPSSWPVDCGIIVRPTAAASFFVSKVVAFVRLTRDKKILVVDFFFYFFNGPIILSL